MRHKTDGKCKEFTVFCAHVFPPLNVFDSVSDHSHIFCTGNLISIFAPLLGTIHGMIRFFKKGTVCISIPTVTGGQTNTCRDPVVNGAPRINFAECFSKISGTFLCLLECCVLHQHKEFIPTDPSGQIIVAEKRFDDICNIYDYSITECMPEIIIDTFKIININQKQYMGSVFCSFQKCIGLPLDFQLVEQFRQRISPHFFLKILIFINIKTSSDNPGDPSIMVCNALVISSKPEIFRCLIFRMDIKPCIHTSGFFLCGSFFHSLQKKLLIRWTECQNFFIHRKILFGIIVLSPQFHQPVRAQHRPVFHIQIKRIFQRQLFHQLIFLVQQFLMFFPSFFLINIP